MRIIIKRIILYLLLVLFLGYCASIIAIALFHPHSGYDLKETVTAYSQLIELCLILFVIVVPAIIVNKIFRENNRFQEPVYDKAVQPWEYTDNDQESYKKINKDNLLNE